MITLWSDFNELYFRDAAFMHLLCLASAFHGSALQEDSWVQTENGEVCSVIARHGGRLYVSSVGGDTEELLEFIKTVGFEEVFTSKETAAKMGLCILCEFGCLYKHSEGIFSPDLNHPPLKKIYDGLAQGEDSDISLPPFEDFAPDLSHRLRHGSAAAVCEEFGTALAFCCPKGGIINGIAVDRDRRFMGLGSSLLNTLCDRIGRDVFVCATDKSAEFYIKNGFEMLDTAVIAR